MNDQKNKGEERSACKTIIMIWIGFIMLLTIIMFVVVTIDRCSFHNKVYKNASFAILKEKLKVDSVHLYNSRVQQSIQVSLKNSEIDSLANMVNPKDSILASFYISGSNKTDCKEGRSLIELMEKSEGLLGSNGLTYLVTLIVALMASLLLYRVEDMEKLRAYNESYIDIIKTRLPEMEKSQETNKILQGELQQFSKEQKRKAEELKVAVDSLNGEASVMKNEVVNLRNESGIIKESYEKSMRKISSDYEKITKFNRLLALNESIYNLSIMIGNVVSTFSHTRGNKKKDAIALEIGNLCSRLSLFCDQITDLLRDSEQRLDYLTKEEHYILASYIDDALSGLNKSMKCIKDLKNDTLLSIINEKIIIVEDIKGKIDSMRIE